MGVSRTRGGQELIRHDTFSDSGRYGTFPRKKAFVAVVTDPEKTTRNAFTVVVNDEGQHALWQAKLELPAGWRRQSAALSRQAGLDAITGDWPDITPASVRAGAPGPPAPAGSAPGEATPDERRRHLVRHSPDVRFAHEVFAEQASRRPGAAAVVAGGPPLTYGELD